MKKLSPELAKVGTTGKKPKKTLEEYGLSYEEIGRKASEASQKVGNSHSILANYTSEMSKEVKEANDAWSVLVGNIDKNGNFQVKSNVKEVIGEALNLQRMGTITVHC